MKKKNIKRKKTPIFYFVCPQETVKKFLAQSVSEKETIIYFDPPQTNHINVPFISLFEFFIDQKKAPYFVDLSDYPTINFAIKSGAGYDY